METTKNNIYIYIYIYIYICIYNTIPYTHTFGVVWKIYGLFGVAARLFGVYRHSRTPLAPRSLRGMPARLAAVATAGGELHRASLNDRHLTAPMDLFPKQA
jgi:hypothetical protein